MFRCRLVILFGCYSLATFAAQRILISTEGGLSANQAGTILPHEHIFTDLRGPQVEGYAQAESNDVIRVMEPLLLAAKEAGVSTLVECTTIGVGRNVPIVAALAKKTGLHIVLPTGVYGRGNYAPKKYIEMSEDDLARWMMSELVIGIENTGVRAGFIKTASSEKELRPLEEKFMRASARASKQTGAAIASHTTSGEVALKQASILEHFEVPLDRFVWVHAQTEPDLKFHKDLATRGAYIEFDSIGHSAEEDEKILKMLRALVEAHLEDRLLLSQDAGWYNPGQVNGGKQRAYTALITSFIPKLKKMGFDESLVRKLTRENPFQAFALVRP